MKWFVLVYLWGPCEYLCDMSGLVLLVSYHRQEIWSNQSVSSNYPETRV